MEQGTITLYKFCIMLFGMASVPLAMSQLLEAPQEGLPLFYWFEKDKFINFGDYLSLKLVERIVDGPVTPCLSSFKGKKLFAIGSILTFPRDGDVVWGSGVNGKFLGLQHYKFSRLDVRAVRGPLTRAFLQRHFGISCPAVYGDPALLVPYFFPEFIRKKRPKYKYLIIPHYSEQYLFSQGAYAIPGYPNGYVIHPTEEWTEVIDKILDSEFVIASSLHGIIIAEAYGIPARLLKVTHNEPMFKYEDYYLGTNRSEFDVAFSVEQALRMGGERPMRCDLKKLYEAFPFEYWPHAFFQDPHFPALGARI